MTTLDATALSNNSAFLADYDRLKAVTLNPARHTAADAHEHCEQVGRRAKELAALNGCSGDETALLGDLARVHDIGKITGTANPVESVALLPSYGITDEKLINLVKYHDTNLPWYLAAQRGEPPSDKAWNKLARKVDVRLLCLFMVADRADCPGGWRANAPLVWFLTETKRRGLLSVDLVLDDGPGVSVRQGPTTEVSAGAVLVQHEADKRQALVIRTRKEGYEIPKGHLEPGEDKQAAALRELREETGLTSAAVIGSELGMLEYSFESTGTLVNKQVHYFVAREVGGAAIEFGDLPRRTKERRWVASAELAELPLVNEELRAVIARALCAET